MVHQLLPEELSSGAAGDKRAAVLSTGGGGIESAVRESLEQAQEELAGALGILDEVHATLASFNGSQTAAMDRGD
jgi:hypothetical protein